MSGIDRRLNPNPKTIPPVSEFKFGRHFSDHMFICRFDREQGWHDSRVMPYGHLPIDPAASVLHYGQSIFEGMKAFRQDNGSIWLFRPDFNWQRMKAGADRLCMPMPPQELFMSALNELITVDSRWVPEDEKCSLYIRPVLIGTEPFLGVRPSRQFLFYILLSPVGSYHNSWDKPLKIYVEDKALRAAPGGLGAVKAGANYAASLQAGERAMEQGYDQVLWLDVQHEGIEEVGTMNVFWVFKDEIVTPQLNGSILPGGSRDSILQILRHQNKKAVERKITITEVMQRHANGELLEAFGTGTAVVVAPIGELYYQGRSVKINNGKVGPVSSGLFETIRGIQQGRQKDVFGWMHSLRLA